MTKASNCIAQFYNDEYIETLLENSPRIIPQYQQHQNEWDFGEKIAKIQELHEVFSPYICILIYDIFKAQKRASAMESKFIVSRGHRYADLFDFQFI